VYEPELREKISQGDIFKDAVIEFESLGHEPMLQTLGTVILLSHDCEYDKPAPVDTCLMASVVPIESAGGGAHTVRDNKTIHTLYLPPLNDVIPESFVSFRKIYVVSKISVANFTRAASLVEDARLALQYRISVFFGYGRGDGA
jgi:hypothetical protein